MLNLVAAISKQINNESVSCPANPAESRDADGKQAVFFLTSGRLIPTSSDQALRELRITSALFVEEEQPQLRHLEGRLPEPPAKRQQTNKKWSLCCLWNIDFSSPVHFAGGSNPGNALPRAYKPIFYIIQQYRTQWRPATTPSLDLEIMNCISLWNKQPDTTFTRAVRQQLLLL